MSDLIKEVVDFRFHEIKDELDVSSKKEESLSDKKTFVSQLLKEESFFEVEVTSVSQAKAEHPKFVNVDGYAVSFSDNENRVLLYSVPFISGMLDINGVKDSLRENFDSMFLVKGSYDSLEDFIEALIEQQY